MLGVMSLNRLGDTKHRADLIIKRNLVTFYRVLASSLDNYKCLTHWKRCCKILLELSYFICSIKIAKYVFFRIKIVKYVNLSAEVSSASRILHPCSLLNPISHHRHYPYSPESFLIIRVCIYIYICLISTHSGQCSPVQQA